MDKAQLAARKAAAHERVERLSTGLADLLGIPPLQGIPAVIRDPETRAMLQDEALADWLEQAGAALVSKLKKSSKKAE